MKKIIGLLQEHFDYVVADGWASLQEVPLAILDSSDLILLVITLEIVNVKNAKIFLEVASTLGYPPERIKVVLNRANSTGGMKVEDVEAHIRKKASFQVVSDGRLVVLAANRGVPFVIGYRDAPVSQDIFKLARGLMEAPTAAEKLEETKGPAPKFKLFR